MNLAAKMNSAAGTRLSETQLAKRVLASSVAVFTLTSIHHSYGAYVYDTPWRLHTVMVSGAVTLLMPGLLKVSQIFRCAPSSQRGNLRFRRSRLAGHVCWLRDVRGRIQSPRKGHPLLLKRVTRADAPVVSCGSIRASKRLLLRDNRSAADPSWRLYGLLLASAAR